MLEGTCNN